MTILVRYFPANLTTEQYDEVLRRLDEAGIFPDAAMDLHISYGEEGSLRVSEMWDSVEQMQAFGEKLMPILADVGVEMAAEPEVIEIRNHVRRASAG
jgi:hypothetical protein